MTLCEMGHCDILGLKVFSWGQFSFSFSLRYLISILYN